MDINKPRETNDKLLPGVGTQIRGSDITLTPPSSPRPRLRPAMSDGGDSGQGVIQRVESEYPYVNLNISQESEYDVFFATEHKNGSLHSSSSLDSTLPIPDQDRAAWQETISTEHQLTLLRTRED